MFCDQCGLANEEGAKFCENCGAELQVSDTSTDAVTETADMTDPAGEYGYIPAPVPPANPLRTILPIIISVGAVALVVVLLFAFGVFKSGALKVVEKSMKAYVKGDGKAVFEATIDPESLERILEDDDYDDKEDVIDNLNEELGDMKDEMEEEFGDNVRITKIEKKNIKKYEKRDIKKINRYLEEEYDCPDDYISDLAVVKVKTTIKGSDDDDTEASEAVTIKVKGKWYVVTPGTYPAISTKDGVKSVLDRD